jgi:hypothetical protein
VSEETPEDTVAAEFLLHINTLKPPEVAVPPIAPFVGDHDLADHHAVQFSNVIKTLGRVAEQGFDA